MRRLPFRFAPLSVCTLKTGRCSLLLVCALAASSPARAAEPGPALLSWLQAQTNLHTWSAEVLQTRSLKTLTQPLTATGRVWFAAPNQFRWELGTPAQTIAVRQPAQMLVIYPRLQRAERYPLTGAEAGPWKDTLALLEAGFPRSRAELEARFRILSESASNDLHQVTLQPKAAGARRMMPQIMLAFWGNTFSLQSTELRFADGSTLRNEFLHPNLNPKLDETLFEPVLGPEIKIVNPLHR